MTREEQLDIIHKLGRRVAIISTKYTHLDRVTSDDPQFIIDMDNCAHLTLIRQQLEKMWNV